MTGLVILVVGIYAAWIWAELAVRWIVAHETPRVAEFDAIDWSNEVWAELDREAS